MISRLRIKNFQVIKDADFKLGRVTVIVGPTASGKSSVMRALRNLAGAAIGHSFVRAGEEKCVVAVSVDGRVVGWSKGKAANKYVLDKQPFDKVGREVPEPIAELMGFRTLTVKDRKYSLNIQQQLDPPFMVDEVGSAISEMLGAAIGYDRLVLAVTKVATRISQLQASETALGEILVAEKAEVERMAGTPELLEQAARWDQEWIDLQGAEAELARIDESINQAKGYRREVRVLGPAIAFLEETLAFISDRRKFEDLQDTIVQGKKARSEIAVVGAAIGFLAEAESLIKGQSDCQRLEDSLCERDKADREIGWLEADLSKLLSEAPTQIARRLKQLWPKLQGSPCPVCGRPMDADCLTQLREHVNSRMEALAVDGGA